MIIGKVVGTVVSTRKLAELQGYKLLVIRQSFTGDLFVAADAIGAGAGELVLVATGANVRYGLNRESPIDALVVGILDREPDIRADIGAGDAGGTGG